MAPLPTVAAAGASVVFVSASKAWNLAGLKAALAVPGGPAAGGVARAGVAQQPRGRQVRAEPPLRLDDKPALHPRDAVRRVEPPGGVGYDVEGAQERIDPGDRIALIGVNGNGK